MSNVVQMYAPSDYVRQLHAAAAHYAQLGWRMIPVHRAWQGVCSCQKQAACGSPGKHPRVRDWRTSASIDIQTVDAWIGRFKEHMNLAIVPDPGTIIVDVDGDRGHSELASLQLDYGLLPQAPTQKTGGGGAHIILRTTQSPKNAVKFRPGLDCKTFGGYVVAAPSIHASGQQYEWITPLVQQTMLPSAPGFLLSLLDGVMPTVDLPVWISRQRVSVQGENGSAAAFALMCGLVEKKPTVQWEEALRLTAEWNSHCEPPWSEDELRHKFDDAVRKVGKKTTEEQSVEVGISPRGAPTLRTEDYIEIATKDPDLAGKFWWCDVRNKPMFGKEELDSHALTALRADVSRKYNVGYVNKGDLEDAVLLAAHMQRRNSLRDWMQGLLWDKVDRMPALAGILGIEHPSGIVYARKTLIGAAKRVIVPGSRLDHVWVLVGKQGVQKSTFVRELVSVADLPISSLYRADRLQLDSKDVYGTIDCWAVEIAELEEFFRHDQALIKQFLTKTEDTYRPPYGRAYDAKTQPRRCFFIGTTNEEQILRDHTGNRRFWVSKCNTDRIDVGWVAANRTQLWAQAYSELMSGEIYHLTDAETEEHAEVAASHTYTSPLQDEVAKLIEERAYRDVTTSEIFDHLMIRVDARKPHMRNEICATLRAAGYVSKVIRIGGDTRRSWVKED